MGTVRTAPHRVRIIGGNWKRTPLPVLDLEGLRPTPDRVRETLFNWLGQRLDGQTCLDLFAGSGALGFEAASRGAARVLMVERQPRAAAQLRAMQAKLKARTVEIIQANVLHWAAGLMPKAFDVVFIDPPFGASILGRALRTALPLVADHGALYIEAGAPLNQLARNDSQFPALDSWQVMRADQVGAVYYHLLRRVATPSI